MRLMYGADALPLMLDQSVFSITMRNTVRMLDEGSVVVVVVVVGGRVVVVVEVVVGGRVVVVVVVVEVVVGGGVVVVVVVGGSVLVVVEGEPTGGVTVVAKSPFSPPCPSAATLYVSRATSDSVSREAR